MQKKRIWCYFLKTVIVYDSLNLSNYVTTLSYNNLTSIFAVILKYHVVVCAGWYKHAKFKFVFEISIEILETTFSCDITDWDYGIYNIYNTLVVNSIT